MKLTSRWQRILAGGALTILMLMALGGAVLAYLGSAAERIEARAEAPQLVVVNQPFDVMLTLHNTTNSAQELISIGLERELLRQGVVVIEMVPPYREAGELDHANWLEYTFAIQRRPVLQPDETLRVRIRMRVTNPGTYQGELTVWAKNQLQADYTELTIRAVEHPAPWLGR